MGPGLRKATLAIHLMVSVGWIGAVVAYLALGVSAATTTDDETIRSAWVAMEILGWDAIVPLAIASLVTGLLISVGTRWGLVRHYWVFISLVLTGLSVGVLLLHMPDVTATVAVLDDLSTQELAALGGDLAHPTIGLVVLLIVLVLNVFKPRGLTRYGHRRQQADPRPGGRGHDGSASPPDPPS